MGKMALIQYMQWFMGFLTVGDSEKTNPIKANHRPLAGNPKQQRAK